MKISICTLIKTRVVNALSGLIEKESPWRKNLVLDTGLNSLAQAFPSAMPAQLSLACFIGDGSTPTSYTSGAITFTQSGNTLTASGNFFTSLMAGMLFKWGAGSGGTENYVASFVSATEVNLLTSATVATPEVGTVWAVNQHALTHLLYSSDVYATASGDCGSTIVGNVITHKRTINFPVKLAQYNVNEIGYNSAISQDTLLAGRIVLPATDVVPTSSYYQVIIQNVITYSPATPVAVGNVGVNIDTSGVLCLETMSGVTAIQPDGSAPLYGSTSILDGGRTAWASLILQNWTQNSTPQPGLVALNPVNVSNAVWAKAAGVGVATLSVSTTLTTSGQTIYGFGISNYTGFALTLKLTTPYVLPVGSFLPQFVWTMIYTRSLVN